MLDIFNIKIAKSILDKVNAIRSFSKNRMFLVLVIFSIFIINFSAFAQTPGSMAGMGYLGSLMTGDEALIDSYGEQLGHAPIQLQEQECPLIEELRARYNSGCWSCLVLGELITAFLEAAKKGLPVTQKAGVTLLWVCFAIWLVFWAQKNVISVTEIQIGNILNDLLKCLFKIAIAYWFIHIGTTAIRDYFITPMMSIGGVIGQQFWPKEIKEYTEDWEVLTDEDYAEVDKAVEELMKQSASSPQSVTQTAVTSGVGEGLSAEEIAENEAATAKNDANFAKTAVPNLLIPGVKGGSISSGAGCRPSSATGGKGSTCHKGVDVGGLDPNDPCVPYIAAGPGTLHYIELGGYGRVAMINHGKVGEYYWVTTYNHMSAATETLKVSNNLRSGMSIKQGVPIGCTGGSGGKRVGGKVVISEGGYGKHVHFEVFASKNDAKGNWPSNKQVDPLALLEGEVIFMSDICPQCNGKNRLVSKAAEKFLDCKTETANWTCRKEVGEGWNPKGNAEIVTLNTSIDMSGYTSINTSLATNIPEFKYKGPEDIMPKSVINSLLGATRAITNTTAEIMVLGNAVTCYANDKNGGAWNITDSIKIINVFMWISGAIIWVLGFLLTLAVAYYLLDISFKIGFAVLAIPVVMGLWPFGFTQGKLYVVLSIIAKSSATFAFLALTTAFGLAMVSEAIGGLEDLYEALENVASSTEAEADELREYISSRMMPFSSTFLLVCFVMIYFYKLVEQTISDLVNKFFPDKAFGDSSPMHSAATMMTSWAKKMATKATGLDLAKDIVAHQTGRLVKGGLKASGKIAKGTVGFVGAAVTAAPIAGVKSAIKGKGFGAGFGKRLGKTDAAIALKQTGESLKKGGEAIRKGWRATANFMKDPKGNLQKAWQMARANEKEWRQDVAKDIDNGWKSFKHKAGSPVRVVGNWSSRKARKIRAKIQERAQKK